MLGFSSISESPMSVITSSSVTVTSMDRVTITNNFTVITDRIGQNLVLGNGVITMELNLTMLNQLAAVGASVNSTVLEIDATASITWAST